MICLLAGVVKVRAWQGVPLSSNPIRSIATPRRSRMNEGSAYFELKRGIDADRLQALRQAARHPPESVSASIASVATCASAMSARRPPSPFLAKRLAAFARVLVGPIPTDTGMPVHCSPWPGYGGRELRDRSRTPKVEEGFVDGIDLQLRGELGSTGMTRRLMSP